MTSQNEAGLAVGTVRQQLKSVFSKTGFRVRRNWLPCWSETPWLLPADVLS